MSRSRERLLGRRIPQKLPRYQGSLSRLRKDFYSAAPELRLKLLPQLLSGCGWERGLEELLADGCELAFDFRGDVGRRLNRVFQVIFPIPP